MVVAELKEKERCMQGLLKCGLRTASVLFLLTLLAKTIHETSIQVMGKATLHLHGKSYKFRLQGDKERGRKLRPFLQSMYHSLWVSIYALAPGPHMLESAFL